MTSDRLFAAIAKHLEPKVVKAGGVFSVSDNVAQTLELLALSPASWRCIWQFQRDDDTTTRGELKAKFLLIVQQGKGLEPQHHSASVLDDGVRKSLLKRFNETAAWLRAIQFKNTDVDQRPLQQGNAYWLHDRDIPTRQLAGEFSLNYGAEKVAIEYIDA